SLAESLRGPLAVAPCGTAAAALQVIDLQSEVDLSSAVPKGCQELRVAFLRHGSDLVQLPNPEGRPLIRQRCLIVSTVLMLRRSVELRRAVQLLQEDMVSSAVERLLVAMDEDECVPSRAQVALPWRALCRPHDLDLPLWCGDYCMPDETSSAAMERLGQLLGLPEDRFEEAPEHLSERGLLSSQHEGTYGPLPEHDKPEMTSTPKAFGSSHLACGAAVAALVAALCIPMLIR
ncbi:unnamed protein product, partial [Polarella glacialis]